MTLGSGHTELSYNSRPHPNGILVYNKSFLCVPLPRSSLRRPNRILQC